MQRRALIVDNENSSCELVEKVLTSAGIESLVLHKSSEAPAILREGKFDVVFLGFHMDLLDGPELTRQLRDSSSNRLTPIVLMSDDPHPQAISQGFAAGASFFLYKPLDKDRVMLLVRATQGAMEHERRKTRRVPLKSKVELRIGNQQIHGETVDISMEGLLVKTMKTVPIGSSVNVKLQLNDGMQPVNAVGCVVRLVQPSQMGIHLGRLNLDDGHRLQEFLLPLITAPAA
jgi:DNA-binding response OmpR family regulator